MQNNNSTIELKIANSDQEFGEAQRLFREYAASLDFDLSFQDFEGELREVNLQYNKPKGALILAYSGTETVGCLGIRELDHDTAELKRMFVQVNYRRSKIAQRMLSRALEIAAEYHYKKIRLDTAPYMKEAQNLYRLNGFYEIPPYRFNPLEGAVYMEKVLS